MTKLEEWITALVLNIVIVGLSAAILYDFGSEDIKSHMFIILLICFIGGTLLIKAALYLTDEQ
jgi:hypothetical protein